MNRFHPHYKALILIYFLYNLTNVFSQETENFDHVNIDDGTSYNSANDESSSISIPLYNVKVDGVSIPIYLSYNNKGLKPNDVPSSVGFNWKLNAGGEINKQINHLVDENEEGWLFVDDYQNYPIGPAYLASDPWRFKQFFEEVDAAPDVFRVSLSNNNYLNYIYSRGGSTGLILKQSGNFNFGGIDTDFELLKQFDFEGNEASYEDDDVADITITSKQGVSYSFRKGLKRRVPYDMYRDYVQERNGGSRIDSSEIKNYYLHKVSTIFNREVINFEYTNTNINKFFRHSIATRHKTNSDDSSPPMPGDPIATRGYYEDVSLEDVSRREIKKISTDKETIEFIYKDRPNNNDLSLLLSPETYRDRQVNQTFKLLDEIRITDYNGNYITGYKFLYSGQMQDASLEEGKYRIKYILKYAKNQKDYFVYKKMDYYHIPYQQDSPITTGIDVLGYPNGEFYNNQSEVNLVFSTNISQGLYRLPNEDFLKKGMLKSITNSKGGKIEYTYKENSHGYMYYGGLLVSSTSIFDETGEIISKTLFDYDEPEGFGLPVYDDRQYGATVTPEGIYEDGYFDFLGRMYYAWQTYFTKKSPRMIYESIPYLLSYQTSNLPFALQKHTPISDNIISELDLQDYNQQESGSFYRKLKISKININNNLAEEGYIIKHYRPSLSEFYLNKILEKIEYYNSNDILIKEELYNYETVIKAVTDAYRFDNVHSNSSRSYVIKYFPIYLTYDVLKSNEIKEYGHYRNLISNQKFSFSYFNEGEQLQTDYFSIKEIRKYSNGVEFEKIENKFLKDYNYTQNFPTLINKINPIVEKKIWVKSNLNWRLKQASINSFYDNGNVFNEKLIIGNSITGNFYDESNYISSYYEESTGNLITVDTDFQVDYRYNSDLKLKAEIDFKNSVNKIYQRSDEYKGQYIDAILTTASPYSNENTFFLKKSFENPSENSVIKFNKAFSGEYVFGGESIDLEEFPNEYEVSFWSYSNTNGWEFNEFIHNGGNLTINKPSGAIYLDEIIVKPKFSRILSFTYHPLIGITSTLNEIGEGERKEYDIFGRPLFLLDNNKNVLKEFRYNNFKVEITNQQ